MDERLNREPMRRTRESILRHPLLKHEGTILDRRPGEPLADTDLASDDLVRHAMRGTDQVAPVGTVEQCDRDHIGADDARRGVGHEGRQRLDAASRSEVSTECLDPAEELDARGEGLAILTKCERGSDAPGDRGHEAAIGLVERPAPARLDV